MRLFLCEKPSQAKDIAAALGVSSGRKDGFYQVGEVAVTWAFGHLLQNSPPQDYGDEYSQFGNVVALPLLPKSWKSQVPKDKKKQFGIIKTLLSKTKEVVIATDADREGEVIGREILDMCQYKGTVSRFWTQALDKASIKKALGDIRPGSEHHALYMAGLARSRADWLIGMNLSPMFTVAYSNGFGKEHVLSIGRVQTPTLGLVVKRDAIIDQFVSYTHYQLQVEYQPQGKVSFTAQWQIPTNMRNPDGNCIDANAVKTLAASLTQGTGIVEQASTERKSTPAPLPYSLSALQEEVCARLKVSPKKVLDIAQALYETHKITSYPRSGCQYLPSSQKQEVPLVFAAMQKLDASIEQILAKADAKKDGRVWNDREVGKESHHAIIPTMVDDADLSQLNSQEKTVYEMIRARYIAQFYPDYQYDSSTILVSQENHLFKAIGQVPKIVGWKEILNQSADKDDQEQAILPQLEVKSQVLATDTEVKSKKTAPPPRFTEASLLKEMVSLNDFLKSVDDEQTKKVFRSIKGIGTEATRGDIIQRLFDMGYIQKEKGKLVSTEKGKQTIATVPSVISDPITTAKWETLLSAIASKELTIEKFMALQEALITQLVAQAKQDALKRGRSLEAAKSKSTYEPKHSEGEACPTCKAGTLVKNESKKQAGKFILNCSERGCKFYEWCQ